MTGCRPNCWPCRPPTPRTCKASFASTRHSGRPICQSCANVSRRGCNIELQHRADRSMNGPQARVRVDRSADGTELAFSGRLDATGAAGIWRESVRAAAGARGRALIFDLAGVAECDMAGAALLVAAESAHGGTAQLHGANPTLLALVARARTAAAVRPAIPAPAEAFSL